MNYYMNKMANNSMRMVDVTMEKGEIQEIKSIRGRPIARGVRSPNKRRKPRNKSCSRKSDDRKPLKAFVKRHMNHVLMMHQLGMTEILWPEKFPKYVGPQDYEALRMKLELKLKLNEVCMNKACKNNSMKIPSFKDDSDDSSSDSSSDDDDNDDDESSNTADYKQNHFLLSKEIGRIKDFQVTERLDRLARELTREYIEIDSHELFVTAEGPEVRRIPLARALIDHRYRWPCDMNNDSEEDPRPPTRNLPLVMGDHVVRENRDNLDLAELMQRTEVARQQHIVKVCGDAPVTCMTSNFSQRYARNQAQGEAAQVQHGNILRQNQSRNHRVHQYRRQSLVRRPRAELNELFMEYGLPPINSIEQSGPSGIQRASSQVCSPGGEGIQNVPARPQELRCVAGTSQRPPVPMPGGEVIPPAMDLPGPSGIASSTRQTQGARRTPGSPTSKHHTAVACSPCGEGSSKPSQRKPSDASPTGEHRRHIPCAGRRPGPYRRSSTTKTSPGAYGKVCTVSSAVSTAPYRVCSTDGERCIPSPMAGPSRICPTLNLQPANRGHTDDKCTQSLMVEPRNIQNGGREADTIVKDSDAHCSAPD